MLEIDGSYGEGGGQILRTSLALSLVTGRPFRIDKIRARRSRPGLMRQHLASVKAAAEIGHAEVNGAAVGSARLTFVPGEVTPGEYHFAIGSAGSTTLVLQTVLPALMIAGGPSSLVLSGGTHNPHAPPFDFLAKTFLPVLNRMGPKVTATLERHGFYPAGGGQFAVRIEPTRELSGLDLLERGPIRRRLVKAVVAGLPRHIAEREAQTVLNALELRRDRAVIEELPGELGPGNVVTIEIESDAVTEVVTGFGQRGVRAEDVARNAAAEAARYLASEAPVGEHLADQLLIPMALAGDGSFKTLEPTDHTRTNIEIIRTFLNVAIDLAQANRDHWLVAVRKTIA